MHLLNAMKSIMSFVFVLLGNKGIICHNIDSDRCLSWGILQGNNRSVDGTLFILGDPPRNCSCIVVQILISVEVRLFQ